MMYNNNKADDMFIRNNRHAGIAFAAGIFFVLTASTAIAQVIPGSVQPSRVGEQLQNQPNPSEEQPVVVLPATPTPQTEVSEKLLRKFKKFTLERVKVEDTTVYPAGTFDGLFKDEIGKTLTLTQAREIAYGITARYRKDGYVLSQAVIPDQDLRTGTLKIRVVEGFVDNVTVENDNPNRDRRNLIEAYAAKIRKDRPLNTRELERYMLLINDLPGVTARATIKPSPSTFGAADLVIQVKNKGIDASFTSDDRGNRFLGPYQQQLTATENSLAGLGERTTARGIDAVPDSTLHYWEIQHEEQLDSEGTRLGLLYSNTMTFPGDYLSPLDIKGTSDDYSISVSHPFLRSRAENLTGRLIFDARDTEEDILGVRIFNDRVRALRAGGNFNISDSWNGANSIDGSISEGLPWLDATNGSASTSRINGTDSFTKGNLDVSRLQTLPHGFSLLTSATGQYTSQPLLLSEQMTLGGVSFGQAYDSGEIAGDSGIAGRVELRYGQPVGYQWFNSYQIYGYYDIGAVYLNDQTPGSGPGQLSLADTGVGVRTNFTSNLYGYGEVGFPLTRPVASEGDRDPRFFYSITARF